MAVYDKNTVSTGTAGAKSTRAAQNAKKNKNIAAYEAKYGNAKASSGTVKKKAIKKSATTSASNKSSGYQFGNIAKSIGQGAQNVAKGAVNVVSGGAASAAAAYKKAQSAKIGKASSGAAKGAVASATSSNMSTLRQKALADGKGILSDAKLEGTYLKPKTSSGAAKGAVASRNVLSGTKVAPKTTSAGGTLNERKKTIY